jgi:hypothetical protein
MAWRAAWVLLCVGVVGTWIVGFYVWELAEADLVLLPLPAVEFTGPLSIVLGPLLLGYFLTLAWDVWHQRRYGKCTVDRDTILFAAQPKSMGGTSLEFDFDGIEDVWETAWGIRMTHSAHSGLQRMLRPLLIPMESADERRDFVRFLDPRAREELAMHRPLRVRRPVPGAVIGLGVGAFLLAFLPFLIWQDVVGVCLSFSCLGAYLPLYRQLCPYAEPLVLGPEELRIAGLRLNPDSVRAAACTKDVVALEGDTRCVWVWVAGRGDRVRLYLEHRRPDVKVAPTLPPWAARGARWRSLLAALLGYAFAVGLCTGLAYALR